MVDQIQANLKSFIPDGEHARDFRDALGRFATGVTLVTAVGPDGPVGFVANSFSSLSIEPPLVLWSVARIARRFGIFSTAKNFVIHILAQEQTDLIARFTREGLGFSGLDYGVSQRGLPVLDDASARFECALHAAYDGGDHLMIVGQVDHVVMCLTEPLVFLDGGYGQFSTRK
ncbi:MAG: flavin reductase (DIM6/NTAB) family NADH-FMN oxidoreductase RutF [Paracoccaceae bacterium]|jgi:flavin reductase (DIM6/NTAB) family NADH-FMN oxidoreductase RutF